MTAPGLAIRPFEPGDLPALQRVRAAAFAPVFRSFRDAVGEEIAAVAFARADAEQAELLDKICAPDSGHHVLVVTAAAGAEAVAFVSFTVDADARVGEIGLNAVRPDHAGGGIGAWMYGHALARMKELGAAVATVCTGADPAHAPARRAYEKAGFDGAAALPSVCLYRLL